MSTNGTGSPKDDRSIHIASALKGVWDEILKKVYLAIAGLVIAVLYFGFNSGQKYLNDMVDTKIRNAIVEAMKDEKNAETEKLWKFINEHIENALKSKAGNISVGSLVFDAATGVADIRILADPSEKTWLLLNVNGLRLGDKILMTDGSTGYIEKISSNGPRNYNMTDFFRRSEDYARNNSITEPPEAPIATRDLFTSFHRISFAFKPARSVAQSGLDTKAGGRLNSKPRSDGTEKIPIEIDLSYIVIAYPPLSVSGLQTVESKSEDTK